jgi:hypothetical protein
LHDDGCVCERSGDAYGAVRDDDLSYACFSVSK